MSDYEISGLRAEVRDLKFAVSSLERAISTMGNSLDDRLRNFWLEFWAIVWMCSPLVVIIAGIIKHL